MTALIFTIVSDTHFLISFFISEIVSLIVAWILKHLKGVKYMIIKLIKEIKLYAGNENLTNQSWDETPLLYRQSLLMS